MGQVNIPTARELLDNNSVPGDEPWAELASRVEAVLALHVGKMEDSMFGRHVLICQQCDTDWPCPTACALDGGAK
jgi:hypothetical protein